jgi:hypothetical protein
MLKNDTPIEGKKNIHLQAAKTRKIMFSYFSDLSVSDKVSTQRNPPC